MYDGIDPEHTVHICLKRSCWRRSPVGLTSVKGMVAHSLILLYILMEC